MFEANVLLFLHALVQGRRLAALTVEARSAFHEAVGGAGARGGEGLRELIPADSRFWEIAEANRDEYLRGIEVVRAGGEAPRAESATLRTAVAALLEITNAGEVYRSLDAALP
jgi:hypothetical protein